MPQPYPPDLHHQAVLLTCSNCLKPMAIRTIELRDSRERIVLACDECGRQTVQDNPLPRE